MILLEKDPVKVINGKNGELIQTNERKPEYSSLMFEQNVFELQKGFLNKKRRVAFLAAKTEDLEYFVDALKLKHESILPGRIYVLESHSPFYDLQNPKINPSTGEVILVDGKPIYRQMLWDESDTKEDVLITGQITKGDRIKDPEIYLNNSKIESLEGR